MKTIVSLEDVIDVLRKIKFKETRPTERKALPPFMQTWTIEKIFEYYKKLEPEVEALDIAIAYLKNINNIEKSSRELVKMFDNITEGEK